MEERGKEAGRNTENQVTGKWISFLYIICGHFYYKGITKKIRKYFRYHASDNELI